MTDFKDSHWADPQFSNAYIESADHFIPNRRELFRILRSFYTYFIPQESQTQICDLGCGDGVITEQLLPVAKNSKFILMDGSTEMLTAARKRTGAPTNCSFIEKSFQGLINDSSELPQFDLIASAFAVHHLEPEELSRMFRAARNLLKPGGYFLNIDIGLAGTQQTTDWYTAFWREWISAHRAELQLKDDFSDIPDQAFANKDNKYSPLQNQLKSLEGAGYEAVDCHYRFGMFTIYSGKNPAS